MRGLGPWLAVWCVILSKTCRSEDRRYAASYLTPFIPFIDQSESLMRRADYYPATPGTPEYSAELKKRLALQKTYPCTAGCSGHGVCVVMDMTIAPPTGPTLFGRYIAVFD